MSFKKWLVAVLLGFSLVVVNAAEVQWVDQIVVVVNKDVITERDVGDVSNQIKKQIPKAELKTVNVRQLAIDNLIQQKLIAQYAEIQQIEVTEKEIDEQIVAIASSNRLTVDQFYKAIAREGVPKEMLRKTIKENILVSKASQSFIESQLQVSPEEIDAVLAHNSLPATEQNRQQAYQFLMQTREQELFGAFVQQLKNTAYIKYREQPY